MGQSHTLQDEIERFVKAAALDPNVVALQPGQSATLDTTPLSLYIHIPTVDGILGVNLTSVTLTRP